jgi:hypothetical protein
MEMAAPFSAGTVRSLRQGVSVVSEVNIEELFNRLQQLDTAQLITELRRLRKEDPSTFKLLLNYMRERGFSDRRSDEEGM